MIVTDIRKGKKGKAIIECDGEFFGYVEWGTVKKMRLAPGFEVDEEELAEAVEACSRKYAREAALDLIARKEVCHRMIVDKLNGEYGTQIAQEVADELEEKGLYSDERYAEMYAQKRFLDDGFYTRRIVYELCGKGIDRGLAEETAERLAPDPYEALMELFEHRLRRVDLSDREAREKTVALLERRGFDQSVVREFIRDNML